MITIPMKIMLSLEDQQYNNRFISQLVPNISEALAHYVM